MRRRFLRGGGRPWRRIRSRGIPPLLIRSNELLAEGRLAEAALGLEQLARAAEDGGGPRGARLYLEAGRAHIMAGQKSKGLSLLRRGTELMAASPFRHRLVRTAGRIIDELRHQGLAEEAEQAADYLRGIRPATDSGATGGIPRTRPHLPTHCPACGAPVRPDEVDWLDDVTAECEFCGSPVRAE